MNSVRHYVGTYSSFLVAALTAGCGGVSDEQVATSRAALQGPNGIHAELVVDSQWARAIARESPYATDMLRRRPAPGA
jgi:hypothetical protein